jgi:NadR type nicotinamide-nucleotide adenylyltransferase
VGELTIVVDALADEAIPRAQRQAWLREMYPDCQVLVMPQENPQQPDDHPDFWGIWQRSLQAILPNKMDFIFASEDYGARLAELLNLAFVPVDAARTALPICATDIRTDPAAYWEYLPACVRPWYCKRLCVFGPESVGKSTLAQQLAAAFDTVHLPEYARTHLEAQDGTIDFADIANIARGHLAGETALLRRSNRLLVLDTDLFATVLWSRALFGEVEAWIEAAAVERAADHYLLLDIDVPWIADSVRYLPEERQSFYAACRDLLERHQLPYTEIRGIWDQRLASAKSVAAACLE